MYLPEEDSYFLSSFLKEEINKKIPKIFLDMGSGSGIQSKTAIESGISQEKIVAVDINEESVNYIRKKFPKIKTIKSDLFENVKGKFDIIAFNPPYLPKTKYDKQIDTTGGLNGSEIINLFLKQSKNHLTKNGIILILTSSLTKKVNWEGYKKELLGTENLFFEKLFVWKLKIS